MLHKKKYVQILFVIIAIYFLGPTPDRVEIDSFKAPDRFPHEASEIDAYVAQKEQNLEIKEDNNTHIYWYQSTKEKSPISVLYLHGFTSSPLESSPVVEKFAYSIRANLYMPRLSEHGLITSEPLKDFDAQKIWDSAVEALQIAKVMGDSVIIVSSSMGGTLALGLAANFPEQIKGIINFSPNVAIDNPLAPYINNHWGKYIPMLYFQSEYSPIITSDSLIQKYWYPTYKVSALTELQELVEDFMTEENFQKIKVPVWNGVYYKNEEEKDHTVSVEAIKTMHQQLGTPSSQKWFITFEDAESHVIASPLKSKSSNDVLEEIKTFSEMVLKIPMKAKPTFCE